VGSSEWQGEIYFGWHRFLCFTHRYAAGGTAATLQAIGSQPIQPLQQVTTYRWDWIWVVRRNVGNLPAQPGRLQLVAMRFEAEQIVFYTQAGKPDIRITNDPPRSWVRADKMLI